MDYGSAISKVIPGTFVPDIGAATGAEAPNVAPIPGGAGETQGTSFKDTVKSLLSDVNDKINVSDQATRDLADGKTNDLQKVVTSVEEANLALNFTMAMRSKLLEAYQEIARMQV
ncbi:MAG TPA: flagellar hook-basal body complex protein FliE [Candidatus Elarobacter sp.]|jgi:flagellar hook-basal body complex protein FliE|nr:flagellar hook-basal body complex protein FliE [Candidatus Elarobacter sp.]